MRKGALTSAGLVLGVLAFLSAVLFLIGLVPLIQRFICPFQVNQGEAINVEFARSLFRGESFYHDPARGPYLYSAYPPLFPFLQALWMKAFGGLWIPGRLLAFTGYWGCAAALAFWGWRRWDRRSTLALALLFLLGPTWAAWGSMVRVDTLMIFLEFAAFLLLLSAEKEGKSRTRSILAAGGLTALALLLKQNAVLLIFAYTLFCALEKKWGNLRLFLVTALAPVLLACVLLQWWTGGLYLKYTLLWVPFGFRPELLVHYLVNDFLPECGWLLAGAALTWWTRKTSLLARCQLSFSLLWVMGLGREAAAENYYLEFFLFGFYFLGEGWLSEKHGARDGRDGKRQTVLAAILAVGFVCLNSRPWPNSPPMAEWEMKMWAVDIYKSPGEHLALDLDLPVMAGKRLWLQPLEYTHMVEKGIWSAQPLLGDIRSRKFATIELYDIPRQYLLPETLVDEVKKNYRVVHRKYGRLWLVPKAS